MKKTRSAIRIPMPLRYLINLVLILALWFVLYLSLIHISEPTRPY